MKIDNEGSAFPTLQTKCLDEMTLRDYFAAQILANVSGSLKDYLSDATKSRAADIAKGSYFLADAMLKEREK